MDPLFASVAIFVLLGIAGAALYGAFANRRRSLDKRLSEMKVRVRVAYGMLPPGEIEDEGIGRAIFRWLRERLPEPRLDTPEGKNVARLMVRAGRFSSSAARAFQIIRLLMAAAGAVMGLVLADVAEADNLSLAALTVGGAMLGVWAPYFIVAHKARGRQHEIASQLSDVLDLLVVCVEAGLGINEAIKVVGSETERQGQEIGRELALVSAEIAAGASLGQALRALAERTNVEDFKPLAATIIQSEQLGAEMGSILRSISDGLRTLRRLSAEEAAQKTTIKILFPLVFLILPAMLSVIAGPAMIQVGRTFGGFH